MLEGDLHLGHLALSPEITNLLRTIEGDTFICSEGICNPGFGGHHCIRGLLGLQILASKVKKAREQG
jgi:hypothetical protein